MPGHCLFFESYFCPPRPYILKAKKFAEPLFQSKKIAEKVRKSGRHFWAIWGNCGPFWVIFGPLWIILGHSRAILGHLGSYLGHFGPFWVIFSRDSRETLKYGTFGRKKFGFRAMSRRILKLCVASLLNILCFPGKTKSSFEILSVAIFQCI